MKVGDKVICSERMFAEDKTDVVGIVEFIQESFCSPGAQIAFVRYPDKTKLKLPVECLHPYEPSDDDKPLMITRRQFREIVDRHIGKIGNVLHGGILDAIESDIFGAFEDDNVDEYF